MRVRDQHGKFVRAAVGAAALSFAVGGYAQGITDNEVVIGTSAVLSGPNAGYSAIGMGMKACFDYVNAEQNGVKMGDGKTRKIKHEMFDDALEPARALQNARRLVTQAGVFAVVGNVGTGTNLAARKFYNDEKVPQVFIGTGGPMFGAKAEVEQYPWTMLGWLSYNTEAAIYANFIKQKYPNAKIALLNDDAGGPFFADAFVKIAKDLGLNLVVHEEHTYSEPTINARISRLAASGADLFVDATSPKFVVQALRQMHAIGWKPVHIIWGVGSSIGGVLEPAGTDVSKGVYSGVWLKDYTNPVFTENPDVKLFAEKVRKYGGNLNPADQNVAAGWYACHAAKHVLEQTTEPTRDAFMKAARSMKNVKLPLMLDGIALNTNGVSDGYPIESLQIGQFDGQKFVPVGGVIDYEGKTPPYEARAKK